MNAPNRRLREARERRGWSQARVAEQIGTDPGNVSRWERGFSTPSPYFRERLAALFDVDVAELGVLGDGPIPPGPEAEAPASRALAVLAYSLFWPAGLLVLVFSARSRFVRFHALQSTLLFGAVTLCDLAFVGLTSVAGISPRASAPPSPAGPLDVVVLLGALCALALNAAAAVAWITGMAMAWRGRWYELPLVGRRSRTLAGDGPA